MANFCARCGIPLAIGSESDYCNEHGGPVAVPKSDAKIPCPYCSESIPASAKKCKHCGEFIEKKSGVRCKTCEVGVLRLEEKYRLSAPVVAIGYVLLLPSVLGIIGSCVVFAFTVGQSASGGQSADAGDIAIFSALVFFVGGLFGWLLVMKKKVLRCTNCSAIVPAS
ncbi:MAG: hypothetical protein ACRDHZ_20465 [Ktedonobacteraceae bacterium]